MADGDVDFAQLVRKFFDFLESHSIDIRKCSNSMEDRVDRLCQKITLIRSLLNAQGNVVDRMTDLDHQLPMNELLPERLADEDLISHNIRRLKLHYLMKFMEAKYSEISEVLTVTFPKDFPILDLVHKNAVELPWVNHKDFDEEFISRLQKYRRNLDTLAEVSGRVLDMTGNIRGYGNLLKNSLNPEAVPPVPNPEAKQSFSSELIAILSDVASEAGLRRLDEYLLSRSYISRYQASKVDFTVYSALASAPSAEYVNVSRWYKHIDALLRISSDSRERFAPVAEDAVTTLPAPDAQAAAEDDNDDDVDLFGEETKRKRKRL